MGNKTDAEIAPKADDNGLAVSLHDWNYEADLLNENHLKYKSGVSLFTDRLEIIAMLNEKHATLLGKSNRDRC